MTWTESNEKGVKVFTSDNGRWGLLHHGDDKWSLHFVQYGTSVKSVRTFVAKEPFDIANEEVGRVERIWSSVKWEERDIGKRTPGEEGPGGGRPIR
jgi:hypothetical protein